MYYTNTVRLGLYMDSWTSTSTQGLVGVWEHSYLTVRFLCHTPVFVICIVFSVCVCLYLLGPGLMNFERCGCVFKGSCTHGAEGSAL